MAKIQLFCYRRQVNPPDGPEYEESGDTEITSIVLALQLEDCLLNLDSMTLFVPSQTTAKAFFVRREERIGHVCDLNRQQFSSNILRMRNQPPKIGLQGNLGCREF
jgi:hypothetical protein